MTSFSSCIKSIFFSKLFKILYRLYEHSNHFPKSNFLICRQLCELLASLELISGLCEWLLEHSHVCPGIPWNRAVLIVGQGHDLLELCSCSIKT